MSSNENCNVIKNSVNMKIENMRVKMLLDTGSDITAVNEETGDIQVS